MVKIYITIIIINNIINAIFLETIFINLLWILKVKLMTLTATIISLGEIGW